MLLYPVHVGKKLKAKLLYLNNKNISEYAQILVTGGKIMIFDIEGHPTPQHYWFCE